MPPATFYAALSPALSQGDIVDDIPWGLIDAPITLCRPSDRKSPSGKAVFGSVSNLKNPAAWHHDPENIHGLARSGLAMVLWHGCQIDKWLNQDATKAAPKAFAAVAPIITLDKFQPADRRADVLAGRHFSYFPIPSVDLCARHVPDSYVDLRYIWSVKQSILTSRVVAVTDTARLSLYEHLFTFFTRQRLDAAATCPQCGTAVTLQRVTEPEAE